VVQEEASSRTPRAEPAGSSVLHRVVVDLPQHSGLPGPLSYSHPQRLQPGTLVQVPLGRREVLGIVWDLDTAGMEGRVASGEVPASEGIRSISAVLPYVPPLSRAWRQLLTFAADYYQRSLGEVALSVLPTELPKPRLIRWPGAANGCADRRPGRCSPGAATPRSLPCRWPTRPT